VVNKTGLNIGVVFSGIKYLKTIRSEPFRIPKGQFHPLSKIDSSATILEAYRGAGSSLVLSFFTLKLYLFGIYSFEYRIAMKHTG